MANTLYEFYQGQGQSLPSIQDRSKIYEQAGLGSASTYQGTAAQNTSLLGYLQKPISATALNTTVQPVNLPPAPVDTNNYPAMTLGGQATIDALTKQSADATSDLESAFAKYFPEAPKDQSASFSSQYDAATAAPQQAVNQNMNAINSLGAQLQGISAEQQAQQLQLPKEGISAQGAQARNITLERNNAIRALPIQAQILAEQAKLSGNQALLTQAQQKFNQVFEIQNQYQKQLYDYNVAKFNAVMDIATAKQKRLLEEKMRNEDIQYQTTRDNINYAQQQANAAFQAGDMNTASQITALLQNPNDPNFIQKLSQLQSQVKLPVAPVLGGGSAGTDFGTALDPSSDTRLVDFNGKPIKLTAPQVETLSGFRNTLQQINEVKPLLEQVDTGPISGRVSGALRLLNLDDPNRITLDAKLNSIKANFLKAISGAAVSESEAKRLAAFLPSINDTEQTIKIKIQELERAINTQQSNFLSTLGAVKPSSGVISGTQQSTSSVVSEEDAYNQYLQTVSPQTTTTAGSTGGNWYNNLINFLNPFN